MSATSAIDLSCHTCCLGRQARRTPRDPSASAAAPQRAQMRSPRMRDHHAPAIDARRLPAHRRSPRWPSRLSSRGAIPPDRDALRPRVRPLARRESAGVVRPVRTRTQPSGPTDVETRPRRRRSTPAPPPLRGRGHHRGLEQRCSAQDRGECVRIRRGRDQQRRSGCFRKLHGPMHKDRAQSGAQWKRLGQCRAARELCVRKPRRKLEQCQWISRRLDHGPGKHVSPFFG